MFTIKKPNGVNRGDLRVRKGSGFRPNRKITSADHSKK